MQDASRSFDKESCPRSRKAGCNIIVAAVVAGYVAA
jgi:hypothetical protein